MVELGLLPSVRVAGPVGQLLNPFLTDHQDRSRCQRSSKALLRQGGGVLGQSPY